MGCIAVAQDHLGGLTSGALVPTTFGATAIAKIAIAQARWRQLAQK